MLRMLVAICFIFFSAANVQAQCRGGSCGGGGGQRQFLFPRLHPFRTAPAFSQGGCSSGSCGGATFSGGGFQYGTPVFVGGGCSSGSCGGGITYGAPIYTGYPAFTNSCPGGICGPNGCPCPTGTTCGPNGCPMPVVVQPQFNAMPLSLSAGGCANGKCRPGW